MNENEGLLTWGEPGDDCSSAEVQLRAAREELQETRRRLTEERARNARLIDSDGTGSRVLAGTGKVQDGREALLLLPQEFLRGYEHLFHRALTSSPSTGGVEGTGGRDDSRIALGRAEAGKVKGAGLRSDVSAGRDGRGAQRGKKRGPGRGWLVRDEKALGEKERIDRALRKLARSMKDEGTAGVGREQVGRCGEQSGRSPAGSDTRSGDGKMQDGQRGEHSGEDTLENTLVVGSSSRRDIRESRIDQLAGKGGCGKWIELGWRYCPWCGTRS